jgi:hypothetical protein
VEFEGEVGWGAAVGLGLARSVVGHCELLD